MQVAMTSSLRIGQFLRGQNGIYTVGKQLQETVWLARYEATPNALNIKALFIMDCLANAKAMNP
jgi:hypothetical protein